jgi:hypothetical protein
MMLWSGFALGGRPLATNDADPVPNGKFQVELGIGYAHASDDHHVMVPAALSLGLFDLLEIGVGTGGEFEHGTGDNGASLWESRVSAIALGTKVKLLDQERFVLDQGVAFQASIPAEGHDDGATGRADYDLTWIATRTLRKKLTGLVNVGYLWVGDRDADDAGDVLHWSFAAVYELNERWSPVAEIVFFTPVEGGKTDSGVNVGVRYYPLDALMLDAAIGTRLGGEWADLTATAGLTWVF